MSDHLFSDLHSSSPGSASRLWKISTDADAFCTECIKHGFYDIRIFMFMERAVPCSCFIICIFGVPEAESVVMLCGQKKITESAVLCHLRPFLRLKADRIKRTIQAEILFLKVSPSVQFTWWRDQSESLSLNAQEATMPGWQYNPKCIISASF